MSGMRLNFSGVIALIVDRDSYSQSLTRQILRGFGVGACHDSASAAQAQEFLLNAPVDLCLVDADLPDMTGFDFVRWMRRREETTIRFMPILILSGYTQQRNVLASRDCGANGVVARPFSPRTLYDHIAWAAASKRPYLESARYFGPDRRFQETPGAPRRRFTDTQDEAKQDSEAAGSGDSAAPPQTRITSE